ncbi:hypothetical protein [Streptacidiphilus jiangxiensis]|uniref:Uncharacterized protein n=1 Tax=Streptacidiphilus jiangxiensis TaxID=235985 RepID=A0A1H7M9F3_STRJI|nr:hypothetical protein [Streptacidiphilus jiangxiensis]SEL07950.1 hypothetical protein SAMN05414137_105260 [Streptacidiphilus jiangxiensis]
MTSQPKPHRIQLFPVLGGLVFLVVGVLYLLQAAGVLHPTSRVVLPLEAAGLVLAALFSAGYSRRSRTRRDRSQASSDR